MRWAPWILGCALLLSACRGDGVAAVGAGRAPPVARPIPVATVGAGRAPPIPVASLRVVYIQPLGAELPDADVALVKAALESFYTVRVALLERVPLPPSSYYPPRKRYRAESLLDFLQRRMKPDGFRILGLTGADISTSKGQIHDWGVLGLATLSGDACVISAFRAVKGTKTQEAARIRLAKVAVHEIGHTLGLPHCPTKGCLMEDAKGTVFTTDTEYDLCPICRGKLSSKGFLRECQEIPWHKPP